MHLFFKPAVTLFFLSLLFHTSAYSQKKLSDQQIADSITVKKNQIKILKGKKGLMNDSLRLELINGLAVLYTKRSKDTSLYYAQAALAEAKTLRLKNVTAVSLFNIASIYEFYKDM